MKKLALVMGITAALAMAPALPANAATTTASCTGQEVSAFATAFGSGFGAVISFEARNPELEGRTNFGEEIRELSHADRTACPQE